MVLQRLCFTLLAGKINKAEGQLLMKIADEEVERARMKLAIDDNMPHHDPGRKCEIADAI